jgi:PAS domain S-box-containing protein
MVDKPDIVKKLMGEEKLGKLESSSQVSHEELEIPEENVKGVFDEFIHSGEDDDAGRRRKDSVGYENNGRDVAEQRLASLMKYADDSIYLLDRNCRYILVSNELLLRLNLPEEKVLGKTFGELHSPEETQEFIEKINWVFENGKPTKDEHRVSRLGQWFLRTLSPVKDSITGQTTSVAVISKDITDWKKTEQELQASEKKFRAIFENSAVAITLTDENERIISWNKYVEHLLGMDKNDLYMKHVSSLYPSKEWQKIRAEHVRQKGMQHRLETKMLRKNNEPFDVDISLSVLKDNEGKITGSIGVIKDISKRKQMEEKLRRHREHLEKIVEKRTVRLKKELTERKNIEEKLRDSVEKFHTLYESATDAIMLLDENGFFDCNAATLKIFGLSSMNRFISKHPHDLSPPKQPDGKDSLAAFNEHIATAFEKGSDYFEWMHKCVDGTIFPANVLLNHMKLKDRDILQAVVRDITEQKRKEKEIIKKNMDLKVAHDKLSSLNKNLEQKVKERTYEVEKLLLQKDEFVGQLGHDLKNPLNPLVNLLPVLEKREHDPETKKIFEVLNRNVNHMRNLVFNTIELARLKSSNVKLNIEDTNLLDEINSVIKMNNLLYEKNNIEIENKAGKNIIVMTDKLRLTELFDNLISNSVKYSPDGGTITIDAKQDKDFVTVSIKDTGKGMTEEQLSHMFDEFYKADEARHDFDSSGLGLPICKRIVEKHGGKIWAKSKGEGKGTTMFFTLPISSERQENKEKQQK